MHDLHFITISSDPTLASKNTEARRLVRRTATRAARSHQKHDSSERHRIQSDAVRENLQRGSMGKFRTRVTQRTPPVKRYPSIKPQMPSPLMLQVPMWHPIVDPLGDQAWMLLHYYRYLFRARSWAINAKKDWFAFVIEDQASIHATLAFVSLNRDLEDGTCASTSTLHHRTKALQLIRQQLIAPTSKIVIDDSLIGAVALLAITDGLEGQQSSATAHIQALVKLVNLRGGFEKLCRNEALSRLVAWADLCHTSTFDGRRRLPNLFQLSDLDTNIERVVSLSTETSPFQQSIKDIMYPKIYHLTKLLAAVPRHPPNEHTLPAERQSVSRLVYYINQLLLTIHHDGPDWNSSPADRLAQVLCYAAHLYISLVLRQMPRRTRVVVERAQRLYDSFQNPETGGVRDVALQRPYSVIVLWAHILYFCCSAPNPGGTNNRTELREIITTLRIQTVSELEDWLGHVSWINGHGQSELEQLLDAC